LEDAVDQVFTTAQLADYLGLSRWTLTAWRQQGLGPKCKRVHASLVLYERAEVDRWLAETGRKPA
jgi:phage terminase Nu1 subunit (DNA packaging protein)